MKKSINDFTDTDCIATPTLEEWKAVKRLFPKIDLGENNWKCYKSETVIHPTEREGLGASGSISYAILNRHSIHNLSDILEYNPFTPKLGDLVSVGDNQPRIFLFEKDGKFHCVSSDYVKNFHEGKGIYSIVRDKIYPYTPPITLTTAEVIEKLKQLDEFKDKEISIVS